MTRSATRPAPSGRASGDRANLYDEITDRIIAELEAGRLPWVQPWGTSGVAAPLALPKNAATGRRYSGINVLILWGAVVERGYAGQSWLTFRQALALGGSVRKGERGTTVVYADRFIPGEERERAQETGKDARAIHFLKRFTVFNVEQCDGLPRELAATAPPADTSLIEPRVQTLITTSGAEFRIGGERAYYDVLGDFIRVPPPQAYFQPIDWHRTALHELGHWTGHASRLGREIANSFGSKKYAQEELVAEMTAAFTCAALGIVPTVRHADYIGSWLEVLREDNRAIVRAASAASKAADFLLAFAPETEAVSDDADATEGGVVTRPRNAMAPHIAVEAEDRYGHYIREARTTVGGHLAIGGRVPGGGVGGGHRGEPG
jgi:antirestriction protein ArdC